MADISQLSDEQLQQALGYKSGSDIRKISDADLQKMVSPADESPEMKDAQWGSQNPVLRALQKTGEQGIVNPTVQVINGVTPAINGLNKIEGNNFNIPQVSGPDMVGAPFAAKLEGDIAGGGAQGLAATAMGGGNPILGYGALNGVSAFGKGQPVMPAVVHGTMDAIPQMIAGKVGSSLASAAAKPIGGLVAKYAPNVGTALGMGGASAGQAAMSGGNPIEAAASGATFGLMSPMNPLGSKTPMTSANHDAMIEKEGAPLYRNILNPGKGIINKVEIKSGGDINDSMKLAAKEALPINSVEGKLDNTAAIEKLKTSTAPMYDEQNEILASNADKQFNLQQIGNQVKSGLVKTTKNAVDLSAAQQKVDNEINAEILRHGKNVDGQTLNMIKQGMWGKSYNPLEPNANDSARAIGYAAKDAIEKAYPNETIMENNAKIGKYLQLQRILEQTHGQVVQSGKIGKYAAQGTGALTGGIVSAHLPFLGELAGPLVGKEIGGRVNDFVNDPSRITGNWAKKLSNINIIDTPPVATRRPGIVTPELMNTPKSGTPESGKTFPQGSMNPLANVQQGIKAVTDKLKSEKGSIYTGDNLPGMQKQLKDLQDSLSYDQVKNDKSTLNDTKVKIEMLQRKIKEASGGNSTLGMMAPVATLGIGSVFNPLNAQATQVKDQNRLKLNTNEYIMKNEGWKGMPYLDGNGNKTVGYGFKEGGMAWKYVPDAVRQGRRAMTKEEGTMAFNKAYPSAVSSAQKFAGDSWRNLSGNQQKALIDMSYQMGNIGFPKLKQALQSGNYNTASKEILNSKYARKDAPERAKQNAILMQQ